MCNNNLIRRSDVTLFNLDQQHFVLKFFSVPSRLFIVNCSVIALKVSRFSKVIFTLDRKYENEAACQLKKKHCLSSLEKTDRLPKVKIMNSSHTI